jgi:GDP-L-fucose synthase
MQKTRIFIAGHKGMVGSALVRILQKKNTELIIKDKKELNLLNQNDVLNFFKDQRIDQVYLAAAKVGGINANNIYPAEFIYENLMIEANIIQSAFLNGIKKLLFLGSSCIYPKNASQPMKEEELLTGKLEPTHGIDYRSVMPTNLYGVGDNYHPENSHVIPGLINRFHHAKVNNKSYVSIWGSGTPKREFLYVDDMVNACIHIMNFDRVKYHSSIEPNSHINIGSGEEVTIKELALIIKNVVGYSGEINFNLSKPDGTLRKLIDSHRLNNLGWEPKTNLKDGLDKTYSDYLKSLC